MYIFNEGGNCTKQLPLLIAVDSSENFIMEVISTLHYKVQTHAV